MVYTPYSDTFLRSLLVYNFSIMIDSSKDSSKIGPKMSFRCREENAIYVYTFLTFFRSKRDLDRGRTGPTVLQRDTQYNYV